MSFDGVANFRRRYVTLWPWPLTRLNFWLSRVQNIGQYKIWGNRIIRGWITDNLTHFCRPILRGSLHGESQRCMQNGSRLGENIRIQEVRFWIANILLHFETRAAQRRMLSKNEAKFLPPPYKVGEEWVRCLSRKKSSFAYYRTSGVSLHVIWAASRSAAAERRVQVKNKFISKTYKPFRLTYREA